MDAPSLVNPKPGAGDIEDEGSIEGFLRRHPDFPVPFVCLAVAVFALTKVPLCSSWFAAREMQPWGVVEASKFVLFSIMSSFAVHGFVTAQHDRLVKLGLKIQKGKAYEFRCEDACVRSSCVYMSQLVYAVMPVRPLLTATWLEFFLGLSALLIVGDAWFFMVHYMFHTKALYSTFHKTHHKWKQPTAFAAYYIRSWTHMIQEHWCVFPLMMFTPIPLSAFLFYQYVGTWGAQVQHSGFNLSDLHMPFCGPLTLGHVLTVANPWTLILGPQTTEEHDFHHENFHGNFALSYRYLDKLFGTYVDPKERVDKAEPLISQA